MDLSKLPTRDTLIELREKVNAGKPIGDGGVDLFALIDAMRPYLRHDEVCARERTVYGQYASPNAKCDCGLDALLAHIQEPPK